MTTSAEYLSAAIRYETALVMNLGEIAELARRGWSTDFVVDQAKRFLGESVRLRALAAGIEDTGVK